mmetsp:Transcript_13560/g.38542  ORF Transcript_13560/g.38542 Transcript_13560/m.38542 type:complete len:281 (-) Transcript_13560:114-956(-)
MVNSSPSSALRYAWRRRFATTCCRRAPSTRTRGGGPVGHWKSSPRDLALNFSRMVPAASCRQRGRSVGTGESTRLPSSIRVMSRMSLQRVLSDWPACKMVSAIHLCSCFSWVFIMSSAVETMPARGVQRSWDMLAMKHSLARAASCAAFLARSLSSCTRTLSVVLRQKPTTMCTRPSSSTSSSPSSRSSTGQHKWRTSCAGSRMGWYVESNVDVAPVPVGMRCWTFTAALDWKLSTTNWSSSSHASSSEPSSSRFVRPTTDACSRLPSCRNSFAGWFMYM